MAEPQQNEDQISIPTPWGHPLIARGSMVVLIVLGLAGGYLSYLWNGERKTEHDEILAAQKTQHDELLRSINYQACLQKLNLYVVTAKDPSKLILTSLPSELWSCLPRFLSEEQQEQRKQRENK